MGEMLSSVGTYQPTLLSRLPTFGFSSNTVVLDSVEAIVIVERKIVADKPGCEPGDR